MDSLTISVKQSRQSTLLIDRRIQFTPNELERILRIVLNRIHVDGINALGDQMNRARSYEPPRGLYRYLTGDLYNSTTIRQDGPKLILEWNYESVILNSLEEMYGVIFMWAERDIREVRELERDKLRELDVPFDESELNRLQEIERIKELEENAREKQAAREANELTPEGQQPTEEEIEERTDEEPVEIPGRISVVESVLAYDESAKLNQNDIDRIRRNVRQRIVLRQLDGNDSPIPQEVVELITNRTMQTLKIVKTRAGLLTMRTRIRSAELALAMYEYNSPVFTWSPSDADFVDEIIQSKTGDGPSVPTTI